MAAAFPACRGVGRTIPVSTKGLHKVRYSQDGRWLAAAGADAVLHVWQAQTLNEVLSLDTKQVEVNGVVFSPDGKTIVTTGDDATIRFWTLKDAKERLKISGPQGVIAVGALFTPDGRHLLSELERQHHSHFRCGDGRV